VHVGKGWGDPLPPLAIQYSDYAVWQRQLAAGAEIQRQVAYWKEHLQGAPELLSLPLDYPRPIARSYQGANVRVSLGDELSLGVKTLARRLNVTLAMTLFTAWSILLCRLSGQDDVVVGMPVANRRRTELEGLIGYFVNTLAVRSRFHNDLTVTDALDQDKGALLKAYSYQDVPFRECRRRTAA
jgi:hypothetical protein